MKPFSADRIVTINVDVQNDFCPGGSLAVAEGDHVIAPLNQLNSFTREHGGTVVFTGDQHPAQTPHFDTWPVHCVNGTEGAALHKDLYVADTDIIVDKGTGQTDGYSGFEGTIRDTNQPLETLVKPQGRERVAALIGGLATDYCVLNTVLDATRVAEGDGELCVFVLRDAIRAVNIQSNDGEKALEAMEAAGAVLIDSVDILTQRAIDIAS